VEPMILEQMRQRRKIKRRVLAALTVAVFLFGTGVMAWDKFREGTRYELFFQDTKGLEAGDAVISGQAVVGRVRYLLEESNGHKVGIMLYDEYEDSVAPPSRLPPRIVSGTFLSPSPSVELAAAGSPRDGKTADALKKFFESPGNESQRWFARAKEAVDGFLETGREGTRAFEQWAKRPEIESFFEEAEAVRKEMETLGSEKSEQVGERLRSLLAEGDELTQDLRDVGRDDLAESLGDSLLELKQRLSNLNDRETLEEGDMPAPQNQPKEGS